MSKIAYYISRISLRYKLKLRQAKCHGKVESAGFKIRFSLCRNSTRAILCDFFKMTHESCFAQPSKTPQNDVWCFTQFLVTIRESVVF